MTKPPEKPDPLKLCEDCGEHVGIMRVRGERIEFVCGYCAAKWTIFAYPPVAYKVSQDMIDGRYLDEARRLRIPEGLRRRPPHRGYPTPTYDEVPSLRRQVSQLIFGHAGAVVPETVEQVLSATAEGRRTILHEHDPPRDHAVARQTVKDIQRQVPGFQG